MVNLTFTPGVSQQVRDNTESLFRWLGDRDNKRKHLPNGLRGFVENNQIDVHATDDHGILPLHFAAYSGKKEVAYMLLKQGANINAINTFSSTALHYAIYGGKKEATYMLFEHGANIHVIDNKGRTALDLPFNNEARDYLILYKEEYSKIWHEWYTGGRKAETLKVNDIMGMVSVWPLADPTVPLPVLFHLEHIFNDARWQGHEKHRADLIENLPVSVSQPHKRFLLGSKHARRAMSGQSSNVSIASRGR